jgi:putative membrane protein
MLSTHMIFIIGLLLGAVMVIFVLQNVVPVTVVFLGWHLEASLALVLILAILAGMLVSALLSLPEIIRKNYRLSKLSSKNERLATELEVHKQKLSETEEKLAVTEAVAESKPTVVTEERTTVVEEKEI